MHLHQAALSCGSFHAVQGCRAAEDFPTVTTLVSPLSGVNYLVSDKCGPFTKGFPTLAAFVGAFPVCATLW